MEHKYYVNRELSWLQFNSRVLEEAADIDVPLCERLSFISIFQSNLDEFFMVRVGSLYDQMMLSDDVRENKTGMSCREQLDAIMKEAGALLRVKDIVYASLMRHLAEEGVEIVSFQNLSNEDTLWLEQYFEAEVKPLLSPQIIGKRQPFPFLKEKDIYAVVVLGTKNSNEKLGIVPCSSSVLPRLVEIPEHPGKYILMEEFILHFMAQIFDRYRIKSKSLIRVVRNADIDADQALYDEDIDYRVAMTEVIKRRKKLCPVKLEFSRVMDPSVVRTICHYLDINGSQVFRSESPLDLSFLFEIQGRLSGQEKLFYQKRIPQKSPCLSEQLPVMDQVLQRDVLLAYPFESMKPFLRLLREAANDPHVVSIKMTLYRVAKYSKVVEALIEAAENGKEVVVLVELRARFDEENNIGWSKRLEAAGCRIIYGLDGLKVHSKLCLITRKTDNKIEYLTQVGTGNYNEKTAKLYTDFSLMTSNVDIALETAKVFNCLAMGQVVEHTEHLLVAPKCLQSKVAQMIDDEIAHAKNGKSAYIGIKINSLTDKLLMDKLVEASKAGVKVELIVRGICCLIAGVKGETENITIISIVGRYLEHSRIYCFGTEERRKVYLSSADFMTRNTCRRVEVAVPVYDPEIKLRIVEMFSIMMADHVKARHQLSDGTYEKCVDGMKPINSQEYFFEQAYENAEKAPV